MTQATSIVRTASRTQSPPLLWQFILPLHPQITTISEQQRGVHGALEKLCAKRDMAPMPLKDQEMDRQARYAELKLEIESLVAGETYTPARYASAARACAR